MKDGVLPCDWKDANITPIYKKVSRKESGNYRPVSLTLVVARVMELIVRDATGKHLMSYDLFCDAQQGFNPERSLHNSTPVAVGRLH